jgi:hypothetical protein
MYTVPLPYLSFWHSHSLISAWGDQSVGRANDAGARFNDAVRMFLYRPLATQHWPSRSDVVFTLDDAGAGVEVSVPWLIAYRRGFGDVTACVNAPVQARATAAASPAQVKRGRWRAVSVINNREYFNRHSFLPHMIKYFKSFFAKIVKILSR